MEKSSIVFSQKQTPQNHIKIPENRIPQNSSTKKMSPKFLLLLFLSLALGASASPNPNPSLLTAYDELNRTGFPIGLLPSGVLSYSLNTTTGDFAVDFGDHCRITLPPDNYLAVYSKRVTGKLVEGKISGLDGIRVRAFFRWWSITTIRSSGDDLVFEVGVASAKYPAKNFFETPDCEGQNGKKASS